MDNIQAAYRPNLCSPPTHSYLLFGPELVKHFLDLHTPVILHAVERILGHGGHHRLLNG